MGDEQTLSMSAALAVAESPATRLPEEQAPHTYDQQQTYSELYAELRPMLPTQVNNFLDTADDNKYPESRVAAGLELLADLLDAGSLRSESRQSIVSRRTKSFRYTPTSMIPGSNSINFDAVVDAYASYAVYVTPGAAVQMCRDVLEEQSSRGRACTTEAVVYEMRERLAEQAWAAREAEKLVSIANARIPPTDAMMVRYIAKELK